MPTSFFPNSSRTFQLKGFQLRWRKLSDSHESFRVIPPCEYFYFRWCRLVNSPSIFTIEQITKMWPCKMPNKKILKISVLFSEVFSEELLINNHCRFKCKIEAQYVYESFLLVMHMTPHDFWVTWSMTRGFLSKLLPKHFDRILFKDMFVS